MNSVYVSSDGEAHFSFFLISGHTNLRNELPQLNSLLQQQGNTADRLRIKLNLGTIIAHIAPAHSSQSSVIFSFFVVVVSTLILQLI